MIANPKHFLPAPGLFPCYACKFLRIDFVLLIQTLQCVFFVACAWLSLPLIHCVVMPANLLHYADFFVFAEANFVAQL